MKIISHSAVILDDASRERLFKHYKHLITKKHNLIAKEMYISEGELPEELKIYEDCKISLVPVGIGYNDEIVVIKVSGFSFENIKPHVILCVKNIEKIKNINIENEIMEWETINSNLKIFGRVKEIPYKF